MNKYTIWYERLITVFQERGWTKQNHPTYTERHHILPRSCGGTNTTDNLVYVTGREHFVLHRILCRCYDDQRRYKMQTAFFRMCNGHAWQRNATSRTYERARQNYCEIKRACRLGKTHSAEVKARIGSAHKGKLVSETTRNKLSVAMMGRGAGIAKTTETRERIRTALTGKSKTAEHVRKINNNPEKIAKTAAKHLGMKRSVKSRERMSLAARGRIPWNKGITHAAT